VAQEFDLGEGPAGVMTVPPPAASPEKVDLVEALRSLASLADRMREEDEDKDLPNGRKP
jgi:hypothetical protein